MDLTSLGLLVAGLALLTFGGEWLVRGASRLAATAGLSPLVIGLTIVAFGTSAPEMATSVSAALAGNGDIALGNVVGSNSFNVLFILGASALITPLVVQQQLIKIDVPLMVAVSGLAWWMARDGSIDRIEGLLLAGGLLVYVVLCIATAKKEPAAVQAEYAQEFGTEKQKRVPLWKDFVFIVAGLGLLVLGSRWFVDGAVVMAKALGASELVIGLTIVAAGTSLPEVATSLIAAYRGERDIAVGNVVGSNLFNLLGVLGISGAVAPSGVPVAAAALSFDIPVMFAAAALCLPIFLTGSRISRSEGFVLLAGYAAYLGWLIAHA
ncbi:MAG: calcium/sodium antiporter [Planctomycetes bacterium]|nr:calcium/sodium antiporter [Planctomycetota bacterium]